MKNILLALISLSLISVLNAHATPFSVSLDTEISGATPTSAPIVVTFDDTLTDTVRITIDASALTADEAITALYLNYTGNLNGIAWSGISFDAATTITWGGQYKADGDGYFDILFSWGMPGFDAGDIFVFGASASGITADYFNAMSVSGGGNGTWTVAAHVQSIGAGEDSGWMAGNPSPIPEPTTMLLFGTGIAGLAAVGRGKK
nr:PEP-CTERM sorting domain-containing protein [uncultured Desulfobulbus sp.]